MIYFIMKFHCRDPKTGTFFQAPAEERPLIDPKVSVWHSLDCLYQVVIDYQTR